MTRFPPGHTPPLPPRAGPVRHMTPTYSSGDCDHVVRGQVLWRTRDLAREIAAPTLANPSVQLVHEGPPRLRMEAGRVGMAGAGSSLGKEGEDNQVEENR